MKPVPEVLTKAEVEAAVEDVVAVTAETARGAAVEVCVSAPGAPVFVDCTVGLNLAGLNGNWENVAEVGTAAAALLVAAAAQHNPLSL